MQKPNRLSAHGGAVDELQTLTGCDGRVVAYCGVDVVVAEVVAYVGVNVVVTGVVA